MADYKKPDYWQLKARQEGYPARSVYKLMEMDEKFGLFRPGQANQSPAGLPFSVLDLGAAPGSWAQYIAQEFPKSKIIAMDLLAIKPIPGVEFYQGDFTTDEALEWLHQQTDHADIVLSDMAPNTTGHQKTDHLRQMTLLEYAWDFAKQTLKPGGTFVAKSFTGGTTGEILADIKKSFASVHHIKPAASRKDSVEMFIIGIGFKNDL